MTTFSQGYGDVRKRARQGNVGDFARVSHLNQFGFAINDSPQSKQVSTVAITDPGDDTDMITTINGVVVTYNTGTGLDQDQVGAGLTAAINAEGLVRGSVIATHDTATDVMTLTALWPGQTFTITNNLVGQGAPSTTAAQTAAAIPFGRAVIYTGPNSYDQGVEDLCGLAKSVSLVAQVQTLTVDTGEAGDKTVTVYEIRGGERIAVHSDVYAGNATAATEATSLRAAINSGPANFVIATGAGSDVIATAEVAGLEFEVVVSAGGTTSSVATTGPDETTSFHQAFLGLSMYSTNDESSTIGGEEGEYAGNDGVRIAEHGEVWVESSEAPTRGQTVYVELDDTEHAGKLYNTDSATRLALGREYASWRRSANLASDALAVVHVATKGV